MRDVRCEDFKKIVAASKTSQHLASAILSSGYTYAGAATAMGVSLGMLGVTRVSGILGLLGFPILAPFFLIVRAYKKAKEREKREQQERDLLQAEKVALQKIIKKQSAIIQTLKREMEELHRMQAETETNAVRTMEYAKEKEARIEYLETLLQMVTLAGEAFEVGVTG